MASQSDDETKHRASDRKIASQGNPEPPLAHVSDIGKVEDSRDFRARFSMPGTAAAERGHAHTIKLKLRDMSQLFNSMDPSPFIEKDLDDDAEEFIVSWARNSPLRIQSNSAPTWTSGGLKIPKS